MDDFDDLDAGLDDDPAALPALDDDEADDDDLVLDDDILAEDLGTGLDDDEDDVLGPLDDEF